VSKVIKRISKGKVNPLFLVRSRILSSIRGVSEIPKEQQLAAALEGLSDQDFVDCDYSLVNNNCEKYVTEWKYGFGNGFSKQVC
jgi:hypothetical protein